MCPVAAAALVAPILVSDEIAAFALGEFFQAVLESDGPQELRRIYAAFYMQAHGVQHPPLPMDWSDKSSDGYLKMRPPALVAMNGR